MLEDNTETTTVPLTCYGLRLDRTLAQLFPHYSRAQLTQWFNDGRITVNPPLRQNKDKVRGGELIALHPAPALATDTLSACDIPLNIVFEDDCCMVINKPAGLTVHPGAGNRNNTLVNALLAHNNHLQQLPRAGLIHRLDKDTTGLLVIAKTEQAYTALTRQMQARSIQRHYQALVHGHLVSGQRIETGYGRAQNNRLKMTVLEPHQGRQAITEFTVEAHLTGTTLLHVKLLTGRTHQIRVHMAHIKHPLIGDPLYGGRSKYPGGLSPDAREVLMQFKRQALHAASLAFLHPTTHELITFKASMPDDFSTLLQALRETHA